ncbi:hypothetical protein BT96DRAFT_1016067 [Gymnopus androsaceus JB14]|uniref:Uncharacterized protein n=1 Tax=Gymnopus androsaceus JB14 TaxID=1447944 RepID=A0A6A4I2F2_9AGAR|nr:hypothetical protein BT96DRAFT_1016067 [Gymnopus androsaceus JB14]
MSANIEWQGDQSTYQKIYEDALAKSKSNIIPASSFERSQLSGLIQATRTSLEKFTVGSTPVLLAKALACQESLLSPIRMLPPEVLSQIFSLISGLIVLHVRAKHTGAVFPLTWVCSYWREIIFFDPSLWSSLKLDLEYDDDDSCSKVKNTADEFLLRSGTTPLCVAICSKSKSGRPPARLHGILDLLAKYASQCRELHLTLSTYKQVDHLLKQIHSHSPNAASPTGIELPILRVLDIPRFPRTPIHLPRLQTLYLTSLHADEAIDLKHLTALSIHTYTTGGRSFGVLLERFPLLEVISVKYVKRGETTISPDDSAAIRHTHLVSIGLKHLDRSFPRRFWDSIYLPELFELDVEPLSIICPSTKRRLDELKSMLIRSGCVLKRLNFEVLERAKNLVTMESDVVSLYEGITVASESSYFMNGLPFNAFFRYLYFTPVTGSTTPDE